MPAARASLLRLLWKKWPETATILPSHVDLHGAEGVIAFLGAIQELCDEGLLSYEALICDPHGPRALQASVTSRGRACMADAA